MGNLREYKCPCCGGAIQFDSQVQKVKCLYCETEFDMEALAAYDSQLEQAPEDDMSWEGSAGAEWQEGEADGLRTYICRSCGGEIIGDENMAATTCPFCGNPVVMMGQFSGALKPDYVIPFQIDKETAKKALLSHYKGKRLMPKVFRSENHLDEIKGIYVPFWLFDAEADADIHYRATRVSSWSDRNYDYTKTDYYAITRGGSLAFERVPIDGSSKMPDDLMESIEPFDFSQAVDFQTAYLAGYLADKYDVDASQSITRANERIKISAEQAFRETVQGYSLVQTESSSVRLQNGKAKYALYPVWLLNTSWKGETYTFAMNGQTGKFVGDLPVDKTALRKWRLGLTGIVGLVTLGLLWILWII